MSTQTYEQWARGDGSAIVAAVSKDTARDAYKWAQAHSSADFGAIEKYALDREAELHAKGPSIFDTVTRGLKPSLPDLGDLANRVGDAGNPSNLPQPPDTSTTASKKAIGTPQAPSGSDAVKADAQSAIDKIGDPALSSFISQALAGGPTSSANISYWNNLGVDPQASILGVDYTAQHGYGPTPSFTTQQSADAWLGSLYKMSPTDLAEVQHKLWQQGWYVGTNAKLEAQVNYGRPDAATLEAYGLALAETARYNHAGKQIGIDDVIALGSPTKGQAKGLGAPFEKTNPADLRVALQSEAQQNIGHDLSSADVANEAGGFLGQEDAARRALIAANAANQTVGVTGPASPTAAADDYIDTHHLADKVAYGAAVRQQAFFSMLKSPV